MGPHRHVSSPVLGVACRPAVEQLSDAIERTFHDARRPDDWLAMLTAAYIEIVGLDMERDLTFDPDTLASKLAQTVEIFRESLIGQDRLSESLWLATLAERLERYVESVFSRAEPVAAEKAVAIRLAALCLAQAADGMKKWEVAHVFRLIAAGITLLERRASGAQPATEAIMLAVE